MLTIENLSIKIDSFQLDNINLRVGRDECLAIIGPTGSGKTLLLESILGIRKVGAGIITHGQREIQHLPIEKRKFSYVPQDLALFPNMSVKENIEYAFRFRQKTKCIADRSEVIVESLMIDHLMHRSVYNLSGGEKQRVALARALVPGNKVLLLDEPFSALHEGLKKDLWYMLKDLQHKLGLSILLVTHDLEESFYMGDKISILIQGKIQQTGNKKDIYYHPATLEVANFMGIKNLFAIKYEGKDDVFARFHASELDYTLRYPLSRIKGEVSLQSFSYAGIRAMEVMILNPLKKEIKQNRDNVIDGRVTRIFEKGALNTLIITSGKQYKNIEIEIPNHAFKKFNLETGTKIKASLKSESLFLL